MESNKIKVLYCLFEDMLCQEIKRDSNGTGKFPKPSIMNDVIIKNYIKYILYVIK